MERYDGFLFSKLRHIGSKSEGPDYFLQQFDYKELPVLKKVLLWQQDPELQKFIAGKVIIHGKMNSGGICYETIEDYSSAIVERKENQLEVIVTPGSDVLWIDKMPPGSQRQQCMTLTLRVKWPYRSIWEGLCPTTQLYDFSIELKDKTIWRWSEGRVFAQVLTPVNIPGADWIDYTEVWVCNPDAIQDEGTYTVRSLFMASGQDVTENFEIKFAH